VPKSNLVYFCEELVKFFNEETFIFGTVIYEKACITWTNKKETIEVKYDLNKPKKWFVILIIDETEYQFEGPTLQTLETMLDSKFGLSLASLKL
jgi:hypothetical protein